MADELPACRPTIVRSHPYGSVGGHRLVLAIDTADVDRAVLEVPPCWQPLKIQQPFSAISTFSMMAFNSFGKGIIPGTMSLRLTRLWFAKALQRAARVVCIVNE